MSKKQTAPISPVMKKLASYISQATRKALPKEVVERTKHHTLDTIAAMVSGSRLPPGEAAISYIRTLGGTRQSTVIGSRIVTTAENAALANGMLAHADETDDSHAPSLTHPGCGVVPAALAMAEREGANGTQLIRAVALGYDVSSRLSLSLHAHEFREAGHSTHSFGPMFGAAAAAGTLAGLNPDQCRWLLSYTVQQASGVSCWMRDEEHIEKAFDFGGMPARNGTAAASMVAHGFTGVEDALSGERNFFHAYNEQGRIGKPPVPELLIDELGKRHEVMRTNIKRWSVGSPIQAPLDGLLELIRANDVKADQVQSLVVRVAHQGANTTNDRHMPDICMQHMCAVMLLDGIVTFESAHDEKRMKDPKVLAVRRKITLLGDDEMSAAMPSRQCRLALTLKDGRELDIHVKAVLGTAQNPMSRAQVDEKCYHLMAPILGRTRARRLCDAVWTIEQVADVRTLRSLLTA
jgi:2-methylcitrate dehydratase PrpD